MNFNEFNNIRKEILNDQADIEFLMNKLFDNPNSDYSTYDKTTCIWNYPECWLARYYLYFKLYKNIISDATILDIGANLNIFANWAIQNGAKKVDGIEPEITRFKLAQEYTKIKQIEHCVSISNQSMDEFVASYTNKKYDVVLFLDVIYYLTNGIDILNFIKQQIKPKYLFLESRVVEDIDKFKTGCFKLWQPSADPKIISSYSKDNNKVANLGLIPSRNALRHAILHSGWEIQGYYDYKDFIGRGESVPRKNGCTDFYLLKNLEKV